MSPLHPLLSAFQFRSHLPRRSGWKRARSVHVLPGAKTKAQVIHQFARDLHFPAWSGENWDAFEESLRSLHYLSRPVQIRVSHGSCPFTDSPADLMTYCEILHDLVTLPDNSKVRFEILFRKSDRDIMTKLLSEQA